MTNVGMAKKVLAPVSTHSQTMGTYLTTVWPIW